MSLLEDTFILYSVKEEDKEYDNKQEYQSGLILVQAVFMFFHGLGVASFCILCFGCTYKVCNIMI